MLRHKGNKRSRPKCSDNDSESEDGSNEVVVNKNHIYFYCDVETKPIQQLNTAINYLNQPGSMYPEIWIHINSSGGVVYDALAAADTIRASSTPIITVVEGMAASAATIISMMGDIRYIRPNSVMLIHQLRCGFYGKKIDVDDELKNIGKLEDKLLDLYVNNTKLRRPELKKILLKELEYSAEKCLEVGLVDEIWEGNQQKRKR
jgi:ATP-dependent protease ClpP protease subunit